MKPLGRKQRQRGRLLRLGSMYRCTVTALTKRYVGLMDPEPDPDPYL